MTHRTLIAGLTLLALAAPAAYADIATSKAMVDAAKKQGTVGEQADGFLGFVKPSNDDALKAAVAEINAGRAQLYAQAATQNRVDASAAGASAFEQLFGKIPAGQYYRTPDGTWKRK
jgi:hypothetical protein